MSASALAKIKQTTPQFKPKRNSAQTCEVVLELGKLSKDADGLMLQGKSVFDGPLARAGEPLTVRVKADLVDRNVDNLRKGQGGMPGSILRLDGCYPLEGGGEINANWVTTLQSATKKQDPTTGHDRRHVETLITQCPFIQFKNPSPQPGEPAQIRWPVTLDRFQCRVEHNGSWEVREFDRAWLRDKLVQASRDGNTHIFLKLPVLDVDSAKAVNGADAFFDGVEAILKQDRYANVVVRVTDGTAHLATTLPARRSDDIGGWITDQLLKKVPGLDEDGKPVVNAQGEAIMVDSYSIFPGYDNTTLFQALETGDVRMEVMPRRALIMGTERVACVQRAIKDIIEKESGTDLKDYYFLYGNDPDKLPRQVVKAAMAFQRSEQADQDQDHSLDRGLALSSPIRIDPGWKYTLENFPSPHFQPGPAPAVAAQPAAPAAAGDPKPKGAAKGSDVVFDAAQAFEGLDEKAFSAEEEPDAIDRALAEMNASMRP